MSLSTVSVLMLLRSMNECNTARYTIWRVSDGFIVTDFERNVTVNFEDNKLQISWLQLVRYAGDDILDWKILHEVMSISTLSLTKLTGEVFDIGINGILPDHSFSESCYIRRVWDDVDNLYDYYYHTDDCVQLKTIAIPSRVVLIDSKQYNIYIPHLNEFVRAVYIFKTLYAEIDTWFDMREYTLPDSIHVLENVHRHISEYFPQHECIVNPNDGIYTLQLDNLLFKTVDSEPNEVVVSGTFDLAYISNPLLIKQLCQSTLLFFLYVVHAITIIHSLDREIR